jgi:hypothetical protein
MDGETRTIDEDAYEARARAELEAWTARMMKPPSRLDLAAREFQGRINALIPEALHATVTKAIETMTGAILSGADLVSGRPMAQGALSVREAEARKRIAGYRVAAAAEGGVAGAGGFLLGMAEFPALLATKIKLLFDIAGAYGLDPSPLPERLYILSIFQLAFSGAEHRRAVLEAMADWDRLEHPSRLDGMDWRRLQQEYRDYIDLPKMAQLIPVVGAPIGAVVNYGLVDRLGETAINAYRMRWFAR